MPWRSKNRRGSAAWVVSALGLPALHGTVVAGDSQAAANPPHPLPAGIPCEPGAFGMHWRRPHVAATVRTLADPSRRAKAPSGSCASGNLHLPLGRTFPVSGRHVLPPVPGPLASHLGRTRGRAGAGRGARGLALRPPPPPTANDRVRPRAGAPPPLHLNRRPPPDIDQRSTPPPDIDQTGQIDQHGRRPP